MQVNTNTHKELRKVIRRRIFARMEEKTLIAKNLNYLIEKAKTSAYALEKETGVNQPTIHRILSGESNDPRSKTLAPLAERFGVSVSDLREKDLTGTEVVINTGKRGKGDYVEIRHYRDIAGSMGSGLILRDQPGEIQEWRVTPDWVHKNIKNHTGIQNLRIVTGFGDSMRPIYNPGDPLICDTGVKSVEWESVYFFRIGNEGFIKRLQRIPGKGLLVISENTSYRDWYITEDMDFEVFGQILKAWHSTDF